MELSPQEWGGKVRAGQKMDLIFFAIRLIRPGNNNPADSDGLVSELASSREGCLAWGSTVGTPRSQRCSGTSPPSRPVLARGETDAEL